MQANHRLWGLGFIGNSQLGTFPEDERGKLTVGTPTFGRSTFPRVAHHLILPAPASRGMLALEIFEGSNVDGVHSIHFICGGAVHPFFTHVYDGSTSI